MDYNEIKLKFKQHFNLELQKNQKFKFLLLDIFVYGCAYIVGGYFRDFLNSKKSRDIDIIVDLSHKKLIELIIDSNIEYSINRHNGIKLHFENIDIDIWSIENNWAFKNQLVKLNDNDKLNSIAKGCFYNYDSLVLNLYNYNFNLQYYNQYQKDSKLEILQKSPIYKNLNPTTEANILRAFYLRKIHRINYSKNTKNYLFHKIGAIKDQNQNPIEILLITKSKYKKYDITLTKEDISYYVDELIDDNYFSKQTYLDL